jgi:uroporphyrinogen-III synthase
VRIALTREAADNAEWARELRAAGALPLDWPCIRTRTLPESARTLRRLFPRAAWIAVCSTRSVAALEELAPELKATRQRFACVGPATARAARAAGASQVLVAQAGTARSLARDLLGRLTGAERVLLLSAAAGRPDFAQVFAQAGRALDELALYQTESAPPGPPATLGEPHAVLFASPSAVQGFFQSGTLGSRPADLRALAISIGPSTSAALRELGLPVAGEARTRNLAGLVQALEAALARGAQRRPEPTQP